MGARLLSAPDGHRAPRLRAPSRARRADADRATGRLATTRLSPRVGRDRASDVPGAPGRARRRARGRERHAGRSCAPAGCTARRVVRSRCSSSSVRTRTGRGRRSSVRRSALRVGERVGPVRLREARGEGRWLVELEGDPDGEMPLPPYIHEPLADPERYQTVYGARGRLGGGADRRAALHAGAPRRCSTRFV